MDTSLNPPLLQQDSLVEQQKFFRNPTFIILIMVALAFVFSVGMRTLWVNEFKTQPQFQWNNELVINNNDGYTFGEGARDVLAGFHQPHDESRIDEALPLLTANLSRVTGLSIDTLMLWMPAVLGSLLVIPLILIGYLLGSPMSGFIAALLASIAHSYYNRTMAGYYDTDMLTIFFPILELYSLMQAFLLKRNRYLILVTLTLGLYQVWYPSAYSIDVALMGAIFLYTLVMKRKELYFYKLVFFMGIGVLMIPFILKVILAVLFYGLFHYRPEIFNQPKILTAMFIGGIIVFFATGGIDPIWGQLKGYVLRNSTLTNANGLGLIFFDTQQTVREASHISFTVFAERISGHVVTFIIACVGYLFLLWRHRIMLLSLPIVGLGFVAIWGGLRFTVYAVPVLALGLGFLLVWLLNKIQHSFTRIVAGILLTAGILYPNYLHITEYKVPPVFTKEEIQALDQFKKIAGREDYAVTWWDYGYPIRYYSDVKTWSDGGKHGGDVNFPSSFVLTATNQHQTANMLRLFTEYTEKYYNDPSAKGTQFEYMLQQEKRVDYEKFLDELSLSNITMPKKSRDVFLLLPYRMAEIYPTVRKFSNIDLTTGAIGSDPLFDLEPVKEENNEQIILNSGVTISKKDLTAQVGNAKLKIRNFTVSVWDGNKTVVKTQHLNNAGAVDIIALPNYGQLLLADSRTADSTYVQMFFLENYDSTLFEPVIKTPLIKIYKLKK